MARMRNIPIAAALAIMAIEASPPADAQTCGELQQLDAGYGARVAVSGALALVADQYNDDAGENAGAVYSYTQTGNTWVADGKFMANDASRRKYFGGAIALRGDLAVIGASNGGPGTIPSGSAYMFRRVENTWVQEQKLSSPNPSIEDVFGLSVAIGDTVVVEGPPVVVGAPRDDIAGEDAGAAYIFQKEASGWYLAATLTADDASPSQKFGWSVSISGDVAIVGAVSAETVYVFERVGGVWAQQAKLTPSDGVPGDQFGRSVSIDGDYIAVGAHLHGGVAQNSGAVYVYRREGSNWIPTMLNSPEGAFARRFGWRVRLDGASLLISAPDSTDIVAGPFAGSVYLYERVGTAWHGQERFIGSDTGQFDDLGGNIAISANTIMATGNSYGGGNGSERVYVFEPHDGPWPDCNQNLEPDDCELLRDAAEDCLGSGLLNACNIANGTSEDCNGNGVPDSCELGAAPRMYWTSSGSGKIQRAYIDGTNLEDLVTADEPTGIALDMTSGKMYWPDAGLRSIGRAQLNGAIRQELGGSGNIRDPDGIAIDLAAGAMYWTSNERFRESIHRSNLDGTGNVTLIEDLEAPRGLALDLKTGKIYWTDTGTAKIHRANLDGSGIEDIVTFASGAPHRIALDVLMGKMYWGNCSDDKIQRANLDGSDVEDLVAGVGCSRGIALDLSAGKVYWADVAFPYTIRRADLDGVNVEDVLTLSSRAEGGLVIARAHQDCNGNGRLDVCDVTSGTSQDADGNGIPDECEPDCNGNGILDRLDVVSGTSEDCNGDGRPDECDPDCNENGSSDRCDVANGASLDCNINGIPDSCELRDGTSTDTDGNGVLDECDPDCNGNEVSDDTDISLGTSKDCNDNDIPDECDLADGTSKDCNGNSVPDECDLDSGISEDCNSNRIPDECEPGAAAADCANCDDGYFGPACEECPGGASPECSGHGTCDDGGNGSGACVCEPGWAGPECAASSSGQPVIEFVPTGSSGPFAINDHELIIPQGGVQIEFELLLSGWGNAPGAPLLGAYGATLVGASLEGVNASPPNPGVDLTTPVGVDCPGDDAGLCPTPSPAPVTATGGCGAFVEDKCDDFQAGFIVGKRCFGTPVICSSAADCPFTPALCLSAPDFVLYQVSPVKAVFIPDDNNIEWIAAAAAGGAYDDGTPKSGGFLRLIVPEDAAGTYRIQWNPNGEKSLMNDENGLKIPGLALGSAQVTIGGIPLRNICKNRFLSVNLGTSTEPTAVRVELLDQACAQSGEKCTTELDCRSCIGGDKDGQACFISSDCAGGGSCEVSGETCDEQSPPVMLGWVSDPFEPDEALTGIPSGTLITATVQGEMPPLRNWPAELVHIGDCEIAPARSYALSSTTDGVTFGDQLRIGTIAKPQGKSWGDVVGAFDGAFWAPPDGLVNVNDILAWVAFKTAGRVAPHVTVLDVANEQPNFIINATDLALILQAFQGRTYPPPAFANQGGPADCP